MTLKVQVERKANAGENIGNVKPAQKIGIERLSYRERQEELARQVMEAVSKVKIAPLSRAKIDAWTAKMLDANAGKNNHSC